MNIVNISEYKKTGTISTRHKVMALLLDDNIQTGMLAFVAGMILGLVVVIRLG